MQKGTKKHAIHGHRSIPSPYARGTGGGVDARIRSAPGRSRTGYARFRKPALYPLSYKGVAS